MAKRPKTVKVRLDALNPRRVRGRHKTLKEDLLTLPQRAKADRFLRALRKALDAGATLAELSDATGIPEETLNDWSLDR